MAYIGRQQSPGSFIKLDDICKQEGCFPQFNSASGGYSYGFRIHSESEL